MRTSHFARLVAILSVAGAAACSDSTAPVAAPSGLTPTGSAPLASISQNANFSNEVVANLTGPDQLAAGGSGTYTLTLSGSTSPRPVDVVTLVDASGSIGSANFSTVRSALNSMVAAFPFATNADTALGANHLGIISFATTTQLIHSLTNNQTAASLSAAVTSMPYTATNTYMLAATNAAIAEFNAHGHASARRVIFLITDGIPSSNQSPCSLANTLNAMGVTTYVFGVGSGFDASYVQCLAPSSNITTLTNFSQLSNAVTGAITNVANATDVRYSVRLPAGFSLSNVTPDVGTMFIPPPPFNGFTWHVGDVGATTHTLTFTISAPSTACGTITLLSSQLLAWSQGSGTLPNANVAFPSCDNTPPVVTPVITGTQGSNDWYTSNVSIHWNVSDPESAVSGSTGCDDVAVSDNTAGTTFTCSATSAGGTTTQSVTVKVDKTTPTITQSVTGTPGANGWYTSDVGVSFSTSYGISGAGSENGCTATTVSVDAANATFTCTATSAAGLHASSTATVNRDATRPVIAFTGAGIYALDQTVTVNCSAMDATSGIDAAHTSCPGATGAAYQLGLGAHTLSASAADKAGNSATASATYTVTATCGSISTLINAWVTKQGTVNSLTAKLNNVCASPNANARAGQIGALVNEIEAQTGKSIAADKAALLIQFVQAL